MNIWNRSDDSEVMVGVSVAERCGLSSEQGSEEKKKKKKKAGCKCEVLGGSKNRDVRTCQHICSVCVCACLCGLVCMCCSKLQFLTIQINQWRMKPKMQTK